MEQKIPKNVATTRSMIEFVGEPLPGEDFAHALRRRMVSSLNSEKRLINLETQVSKGLNMGKIINAVESAVRESIWFGGEDA